MPFEPFYLTNRIVAIVTPKTSFVEWINAVRPAVAGASDARDEPLAFLIPIDETDDPDELGKRWIHRNWRMLFEHLLREWDVDSDLWPRNRTTTVFRAWCDVRFHSMVFDCTEATQLP